MGFIKKNIIKILLVIIIFLAFAWGYLTFLHPLIFPPKTFQAVFLTNNQVYFGHIVKVTRQNIYLTDIYYLQIKGSIQPKEKNKEPKLSLVKLGNEIHGPQDLMIINRDQVVFIENLKDDSKVVKAIKEFESKNKK